MSALSWRARAGAMATWAYARVRATGVLERPLGRRAFLGAYFTYKRLVEDPFAGLLRSRPELFAGGDILDVGANVGYTAHVFARGLSEGHKVHAFEPEGWNFARLEETTASLGEQVVRVRAAVGARAGEILLWRNPGHHADHRVVTAQFRAPSDDAERVPLLSLDGYVHQQGIKKVALVKIDVQGFEPEVILGMSGLVSGDHPPVVVLELSPSSSRELGLKPRAALDPLTTHYDFHLLGHGGKLEPTDLEGALAAAERASYLDVVALPR
jgi:FkbM family methyltransferase